MSFAIIEPRDTDDFSNFPASLGEKLVRRQAPPDTIRVVGTIDKIKPKFQYFFVTPVDFSITGGKVIFVPIIRLKESGLRGTIRGGMQIVVMASQQTDGRWKATSILRLDNGAEQTITAVTASARKTSQRAGTVTTKVVNAQHNVKKHQLSLVPGVVSKTWWTVGTSPAEHQTQAEAFAWAGVSTAPKADKKKGKK